ncbi:MAG TPA: energy transducer TonB [Thermoanaerobaculia bacterium]|nr:energy transducer TonB [Thermoanaerobaculia bacterium]
MRRFGILLLSLAISVSARAAIYEARTPHHSVTVETVPAAGDRVVFKVTVTELPGGRVLTVVPLSGLAGKPLDKTVDVDGQHIAIYVGVIGNPRLVSKGLACRVDIGKGDMVVDSISTTWATQAVPSMYAPGQAPLRVGGDVKAPVIIHRVEPVYTEVARKAAISGIVIVEVIIDRAGTVKDARVLKPLPFGLDQAAIEAVRKWTFRPGTLNGRPVNVIYTLTVNFRLPEKTAAPPR